MTFNGLNLNDIKLNPFSTFSKKWALLTAGDREKLNTMTVSWGGTGVIWQKNVTFVFVRPQRYTFEFMEKSEFYSLSFLEEGYRDILTFCGTNSGRDKNKIEGTGLIPIFDYNAPCFKQAEFVCICKKIYGQFIDPSCFIDESINREYPNDDYHKIFIGEVVNWLGKV